MTPRKPTSANFGFLVAHDPLLDHLGALAERYFAADPSTSLLKLRQFGEALAQRTAAQAGLYASTQENQLELLDRLRDRGLLPREVADLFHGLRKGGNAAAHDLHGDHREALAQLRHGADQISRVGGPTQLDLGLSAIGPSRRTRS